MQNFSSYENEVNKKIEWKTMEGNIFPPNRILISDLPSDWQNLLLFCDLIPHRVNNSIVDSSFSFI